MCARNFIVVLLILLTGTADARTKNGFDLDNASVPAAEILSGGPPRDGIPAINNPKFVSAEDADYLIDDDRILGLEINGRARAYPIRILNWHEIVNDRIGSQSLVVTYCPLCGTGMVFASNAGDSALIFGVSGLLYNSDMLLFDRNTESLWSQIMAEAISGKLKGVRLPQLPARHTSWGTWRATHPTTEVMSDDTGYRRSYDRSPYAGYERDRSLYFKVSEKAPKDYHPKALVLGVDAGGVFKAYPFEELTGHGRPVFQDEVAGQTFTIHWDEADLNAYLTDAEGRIFPSTTAYWFAWYAFHPDTDVFKAPSPD